MLLMEERVRNNSAVIQKAASTMRIYSEMYKRHKSCQPIDMPESREKISMNGI
jgi:hypothetical protein